MRSHRIADIKQDHRDGCLRNVSNPSTSIVVARMHLAYRTRLKSLRFLVLPWYNVYNVVIQIQQEEAMNNPFGAFVKSRRIDRRITLRTFSESLGYDPANYSRMERGQLMPPTSADKLAAIARELGIHRDSADFREMVRLASLGRGEIPPAILSDHEVMAKLPVLFRTLEGDRVDSAVLDELFDTMKRE